MWKSSSISLLLALMAAGVYGQNNTSNMPSTTISVKPFGVYGGCLNSIYKYASYEYIVKKGYPSAVYLVNTHVYGSSIEQNKANPTKKLSIPSDALGSCVAAPGKAISHCKIGMEKPVPIADTSTPPCFLVVNAYQDPVEGLLRVDFKEPIDAASKNSNSNNNNNNNNNNNKQNDNRTPTETRSQPTSSPSTSIISAPGEKGLIGNPEFKTTTTSPTPSTKVHLDDLSTGITAGVKPDSSSASCMQSQLANLAVWYQLLAITILLISWSVIVTL